MYNIFWMALKNALILNMTLQMKVAKKNEQVPDFVYWDQIHFKEARTSVRSLKWHLTVVTTVVIRLKAETGVRLGYCIVRYVRVVIF